MPCPLRIRVAILPSESDAANAASAVGADGRGRECADESSAVGRLRRPVKLTASIAVAYAAS